MKLRKILPYIWFMEDVRIVIVEDNMEEAFVGSVIDIPYWLGEYYLFNGKNGEAISIDDTLAKEGKRPILEIMVAEDRNYKETEENER